MQPVRILGARAGQMMPHLLPEIDRSRRAGIRVLLLVPEQYTLQAERELIAGLHLPGLMDVDVLSPRRLHRRIHERGGRDPVAPLDDRGRSMAISQALHLCREELHYYRRVASQPGLPDKVSVLLQDMQKAGLTPDQLMEHAQTLTGAARSKEKDLAMVWAAYEQVIAGRFADETMQQQEAIRRLPASHVMDGADVWVYGFDVLQQPFCELLVQAAPLARSITVTLTMDAKEAADGRVFLTQRRSARELIACLDRQGIPHELRYLPLCRETKDPALRHLERHLFTRRDAPFDGDSACITLHAAANPYAEAAYAAAELRRWHDAGVPWSRMAVALAMPGAMDGILAVTLEAAGIPHYLARKDSALRHGLCRMLTGALQAIANGFAQKDVLDMAKSGFSPLTAEEACLLENYAIENGINRGKWLRPFERGNAEAIELLRLRLMEPVLNLRESLRQARTAAASVEAVFRMLEDVGAYERLLQRENELLTRGMAAEAACNRQVWQLVMDLLDQLHALLGESRAAMKDMARFIASGLAGASISSLPPQPDTVMVGEAGHLMTGHLDALLVVGMQDGALSSGLDSLLSERERAALCDATHRAIGLTGQEQAALRQSDFYRTLALPDRLLTLTFSQGNQDGGALRPAGLIRDVQRLYPGKMVTGGVTADGTAEPPLSPLLALDGLALRLRQMADGKTDDLDPRWQEALRVLWRSEQWGERVRQVVSSLNAQVKAGQLTREQTRRLFTQDTVSISRLEQFAACPYKHFVDYGLKPVKRQDFVFDPAQRGDFFHEALQQYATLASALPDWPDVDEEETERLMDQVLAPMTARWQGGPLTEDAMGRQLGQGYIRDVRRAAWLFTRHARNSRFTTWGTEVAFGEEGGLPPVILTLHDGRRVALRGKIDRIDRYQGDKGLYLRVIDYKSSQHQIDPTRLWYGLQLQLLLYLKAASQLRPDALPAGAFYFMVKDPMVSAPEDVKAEAERLIARELRLKGVVLAETEVVEAMDAQEQELSLGKIFNKDGSVAAHADAYDLEEMRALLLHVQQTAAELTDRIREGRLDISPAQDGPWCACDWCDYAAVCGLDPALPGGEKRVLTHLSREELTHLLANKQHAGEETDHLPT
ncbi:MAG: PD-(D/E)XK nuclease family protein [Aristaeellaceae bacterium]